MSEEAACPRCAARTAAGQEYCLTCGLRLPGRERLGAAPGDGRAVRLRALGLGAVAIAGAAAAIAVTADDGRPETVRTATGGSATVAAPLVEPRSRLAVWPRDRRAWTIVLASVPKAEGRDEAVAIAQQARQRGLRGVGVLDSSVFASLGPGYWMAFAGSYPSEAEATGRLRGARAVVKGARVQLVER